MGSVGHFNTSSTVKDITASTKIRKVGPKASKFFSLFMGIDGKFLGGFYGSQNS